MGRGGRAADKMRGKREAHLKAASSFCVCLLRLTAKKLQPRRGFDPFRRFLPSTALCESFSPPVLVRAATTHCDSCRPNFLPISQLYERSSLRNCLFRWFFVAPASRLLSILLMGRRGRAPQAKWEASGRLPFFGGAAAGGLAVFGTNSDFRWTAYGDNCEKY